MTNFFSAGLQLYISSDITYSFVFMHTVQGLRLFASEQIWLLYEFRMTQAPNDWGAAEELRRAHVAAEGCNYEGANAKERAANNDCSFIKVLDNEATRYSYIYSAPWLQWPLTSTLYISR